MLGRRRSRRARGDRGAAAVEFAIVVPVLLLILLGILEFAFVMRDYLSVSSPRVWVPESRPRGPGEGGDLPDPLPVGMTAAPVRNVPHLAQSTADAIQRAGTAMPQDMIDEIWVYRANTYGFPDKPGNDGSAQTLRRRSPLDARRTAGAYRWIDAVPPAWGASDTCRAARGIWNSINACINDPNAQSVGVLMSATHPFLTGFFRTSLTITERTVTKFEPLPNNICNGTGSSRQGVAHEATYTETARGRATRAPLPSLSRSSSLRCWSSWRSHWTSATGTSRPRGCRTRRMPLRWRA